ncbi:AraC family transcriptional regulator [Acidisoma sp. L85]|uniref:AraC family transcriptional regulator n=1 Tax=Acidisoma sp. L85 TaxID=1641850 RepID=UPI00131CAA3B|nr:AraC family transcriptional regulator [Acidisoma sp. L85]
MLIRLILEYPALDWLSHLFTMMPVSGRLDLRCLYGAPWRIDQAAADIGGIAYHAPLAGSVILEDPQRGLSHRLDSGDILLVPSGLAHSLYDGSGAPPGPASSRPGLNMVFSENAGSGERLDMLCGHFFTSLQHNRVLRAYLPPLLIVRGERHVDVQGQGTVGVQVSSLLSLMRSETENESLGGDALLNALSTALFTLTLRLASTDDAAPAGLLALAAHPRLSPALTAMFEDPAHSWTLPELSRLCNMSRATFARYFQRNLGHSAADLLLDIRMILASNELKKPSSSVASVAETVGYQSEAAFQRVFKQKMGITPAQWRRASASKRSRRSSRT